jgi:hypothetical protein
MTSAPTVPSTLLWALAVVGAVNTIMATRALNTIFFILLLYVFFILAAKVQKKREMRNEK